MSSRFFVSKTRESLGCLCFIAWTVKTPDQELLEADRRWGELSLRVPGNTDRSLTNRERDGDVTQLRMLDPCEFWQEAHTEPRCDQPRHRRHIIPLKSDLWMNAREVEELVDEDAQAVAALHCDERLIHKFIQIDFIPLGKRMSERNRDKKLL